MTSRDFDTFLILISPSATDVIQDDNSGGGTNAQIMANTHLEVRRIEPGSLTQKVFFEEYQKKGIPVVIKGLLQSINWDLEYLCQELKDIEFPVRYYGRERYTQDKREWKSTGSGVEAKTCVSRSP